MKYAISLILIAMTAGAILTGCTGTTAMPTPTPLASPSIDKAATSSPPTVIITRTQSPPEPAKPLTAAEAAVLLLAPERQKILEDLLLPRWKQNIGLFGVPNNYAGRWVGALIEHLGEQPAKDFLKKLADQKPYFYTQPEVARNGLLAGEWDINMQGINSAVVSVRKGDPIGWVALDPTTLSPDIIGLFKLASHPYAAMLFLDFFVSPEGQKVVAEVYGGVTPEELEKREKEGVKLPARISFQSPADVDKIPGWMKLFEELVMKK